MQGINDTGYGHDIFPCTNGLLIPMRHSMAQTMQAITNLGDCTAEETVTVC